jgi:predicted ATP-dependent endonuclease of OLD family
MYINSIEIKNYKSFPVKGEKVDFNPKLNILIGKNGSGKSTIIEGLRLANPSLLVVDICNANPPMAFSKYDIRKLVDVKNLHLYSKDSKEYFEITISFKGFKKTEKKQLEILSGEIKDFNDILTFDKDGFVKYTLRYFPHEQYFQCCYLKSFETNLVKSEVARLESLNEKAIFNEELKVTRTVKGSTEQIEYKKYINSELQFNDYPEIHLLYALSDYFDRAFIPPYTCIPFALNSRDYIDETLPNIIDRTQLFADTLNKNPDSAWGKINKKWINAFSEFSKRIIGEEIYRFNVEEHDYQKERKALNGNSKEKDNKKISLYFHKDGTPGYGIEYESLGDGVKRALSVFSAIKLTEKWKDTRGDIRSLPFTFIDEISLNMEHKLVNEIFKFIKSESNNRQIILTTHSNFFIDEAVLNKENILKIDKHESKTQVLSINKKEQLLDIVNQLGYKASQLLQTNGVIWVEGQSDVIYIEHFLNLYFQKHNISHLKRGVNYEFLYYGGSNVKHYTFDDDSLPKVLINYISIQPNYFFVFDRDNFDKTPRPKREENKLKLMEQINNDKHWWMTQDRTIECYLKQKEFNSILYKSGKNKGKIKNNKIDFAIKYTKDEYDHQYWFRKNNDLEEQIKKLAETIDKWNKCF